MARFTHVSDACCLEVQSLEGSRVLKWQCGACGVAPCREGPGLPPTVVCCVEDSGVRETFGGELGKCNT